MTPPGPNSAVIRTTPTDPPTPSSAFPPGTSRAARSAALAAVAVVVAVAVVARFVTTSPLWLDEALSVNISRLGVGDLLDALRHDGHPPLYYLLLHGWMGIVGEGDTAVRVLSGLLSVAALPLAFVAGRRRAGATGAVAVLLVSAVTPFAIRYATETRMYSLVTLLVLGGWLLADDLLRAPSRGRWAGLAAVTGAAVLTHYWVLHLGIAAAGLLAWRAWRSPDARRAALRVGAALAVGALAFVPWLGSFAYQVAHTGTPWAGPSRPTAVLLEVVVGLGGGPQHPEGPLFGFLVVVLALLALVLVPRPALEPSPHAPRGHTLSVDLATVPTVRRELSLAGATLTVGVVAGYVTSSAFAARYASVILPFVLIAAGVALAELPSRGRLVAGVAVVGLASAGVVSNIVDERTQGRQFAEAVAARAGPHDVVAICPDQLGPATLRSLPGDLEVVGLPALTRPERVDWADYAERNEAADPAAAADAVHRRAGAGSVWLVFNASYETYEGFCEAVAARLGALRPGSEIVVADAGSAVFEHGALVRFP